MEHGVATVRMVVEVVLAGSLMLLIPHISRRGLLFGVYVGEEASRDERAAELGRKYTLGGVAWTAVCLAAGVGVMATGMLPRQVMTLVLPVLTLLGFMVLYLRAYFRSCEMAVTGGPPPAAAYLVPGGEARTILPAVAIVVSACCGVFAVAYAWLHYAELPARVPTHFSLSGVPDGWRPKSVVSVMGLPILTLVMGTGSGVIPLLTARAKRAIRYPAAAASAEAQARFRLAMTRYLAAGALAMCGLLTNLSVGAINVGLGTWPALRATWAFTGLLLSTTVGGAFLLALRYGQGGARLERGAETAPLTNGLADNRHWVLGSLYVNHEDPAILVEVRFGLGYTLNLGNWKAVAMLVGFVGLIMTIAAVSLVAN